MGVTALHETTEAAKLHCVSAQKQNTDMLSDI